MGEFCPVPISPPPFSLSLPLPTSPPKSYLDEELIHLSEEVLDSVSGAGVVMDKQETHI